ncbi:MAG: hypothetical protein FWD73_01665 [Polyangiaceae bacterium]|nr:hypothetical protein [Polyangiaceae bacterium]
MRWNHLLSYFFGGAFLCNAIPHFIAGVTGSPFQSPFASPPGKGLSSANINTAWGLVNLLIAYLLLVQVGAFSLKRWGHAGVFFAGVVIMAFLLAHSFAPFHGGAL